jgi:hypothetical protein
MPLAIDRRCRICGRKACNEAVARVGKIPFTINEIGEGFPGITGNTGTGMKREDELLAA